MADDEHYLNHLLSGAAAGLVADCATHPIDTIRVRLQVQRGNVLLYKGMVDAFFTILRKEGWRSLYKGFGSVAFFTIPAHGLYFFGYELTKRQLQPNKPLNEKGPVVHFIAGLVAEFFGSLIWTPMDVIKQRLQLEGKQELPRYQSSLKAISIIYREEGLLTFFKGLGPALLTYGPFVGIYFVCYEYSKDYFGRVTSRDRDQLPLIYSLVGGGVSGGFAAAVTCPFDVVKTRIQVQSIHTTNNYTSVSDAIKQILHQEGFKAFFKGLSARILWIAPGCAITIAAYEQFKKIFQQ